MLCSHASTSLVRLVDCAVIGCRFECLCCTAEKITAEMIASLGDKNWKIRGEGLEQV
jgi:hypothetical protein